MQTTEMPERWLKMEVFTDHHRIIGEIWTAQLRTNGTLNSQDLHLLLERASTKQLLRPAADTIASGFARVSKESILLVVPNEDNDAERTAQIAKIYSRPDLHQHRALIGLGNFEVSGNLHVDPAFALNEVLLYRNEFFVGLTDATFTFLPNPAIHFTANSVLINRGRVDFLCAGLP